MLRDLDTPLQVLTPNRPSTWLYGEGGPCSGAAEVWAVEGDPSVAVSILVADGRATVMLNRQVVGTSSEHCYLRWAMKRFAAGESGFWVLTE